MTVAIDQIFQKLKIQISRFQMNSWFPVEDPFGYSKQTFVGILLTICTVWSWSNLKLMTLFLQSGSFVCDLSKWNVIQTWCFYPYFIFSALNILLVTVSINLFQKNSVSSWLPRYLLLHISNRGITNSLIIQWKDINIANLLMLNFSPSVTHNCISL